MRAKAVAALLFYRARAILRARSAVISSCVVMRAKAVAALLFQSSWLYLDRRTRYIVSCVSRALRAVAALLFHRVPGGVVARAHSIH